ncbi:MAG TPA: hypothetical protein VK421_04260 [Pyrinomonadaceae bacterium]|nr:hypothetical protein [Pyrinomonadaceae bacterium]
MNPRRGAVDRARPRAGTLELQRALSEARGREAGWAWYTVHLGGARDVMPVGHRWDRE